MPDDEQPQNRHGPERTSWFGQRGNGGYRPQTWQGAIVALVIVLFSVVASSKGRIPPEALLVLPIIAIPAFIRRRHRK